MHHSEPSSGDIAALPDSTAELVKLRDFFELRAQGTSPRLVAPGELIHHPDSPADRIYFIERGEVRLHQPGPGEMARLVEILGPGDWFGVAALAGSVCCGKHASAVTEVAVTEVPIDRFLTAMEQNPSAAVMFMRDLARRLHTARNAADRFVFDDCERRILKTLVDFSRTAAASPVQGADDVVLRITHHQLAQAIGVARETVSLALTKLRHQHLVQTGRNRLVFNPTALHNFANRNLQAPKPPAATGVSR